ncbi:MAG: hypothetical protein NDF55_03450 [archaeon GB-1867-005]|nr:hypothetical protein [Candidatus Culexmicrobium cathedralense]
MSSQSNEKYCLIINSSTIITLNELDQINLINKAKEIAEIYIPNAVKMEVGNNIPIKAKAIQIKNNAIPPLIKSYLEGLGEGEKEVIITALTLSQKTDKTKVIAITDDKQARRKCKQLKIRVKGTLGLIKILEENNIITKREAIEIIEKLPKTSLYITKELVEKAKEQILTK